MRSRLLLLGLMMLMAACRLSERQQVGVLKFAATTIAGATTQSNAATVVSPSPEKPKHRATPCAQRGLQRMQLRVHRLMTRVIRFAAIPSCPKARPSAVRS